MVRVVRLERTVSWSQTRRDTNFAIPGYSISVIIPQRGGKSKIFCLWSFMWSKPILYRFRQSVEIPQMQVSQGFAVFRLTLSRIQPRHSQSRRATNCATPGYFVILSGWSYFPPKQAPYQLDHSRMPVGHYTPSVRKKQPENTYPRTKKKSIRYKITGMPGLP